MPNIIVVSNPPTKPPICADISILGIKKSIKLGIYIIMENQPKHLVLSKTWEMIILEQLVFFHFFITLGKDANKISHKIKRAPDGGGNCEQLQFIRVIGQPIIATLRTFSHRGSAGVADMLEAGHTGLVDRAGDLGCLWDAKCHRCIIQRTGKDIHADQLVTF